MNIYIWILALDILAPAVRAALWKLKPAPKLPAGWKRFLGSYYKPSDPVIIEVVNGTTLFFTMDSGNTALNLSSTSIDGVLRAHPATIASGKDAGCRWLDDGTDQEYVKHVSVFKTTLLL